MGTVTTIILPEWEELKKQAINWEIGKVYTHADISDIIRIKTKTAKYYNCVNKAIEYLLENGIRLVNVKNTGYKVIAPNEWIKEIKKNIKKGTKHTQFAKKLIDHAPLLQMNEETRNECLQLHDYILKQKYMNAGGVIEINGVETKNRILIGGKK